MAIKRYTAIADTTITNAFESDLVTRGTKSNMGASDIIEAFSIYAQSTTSSLERSRILMKHSVSDILADRQSGNIPASGSVSFYLRVFNAKHGQSLPKKYYMDISPVSRGWTEGTGLDMEGYRDKGSACWLSASSDKVAQVVKTSFKSDTKGDYASKYISIYNGLNNRINFWFQATGVDTAPVLTGTEYEINISSETTKEGIAEEYRNLINTNTAATGLTAAFSGSSTSVVLVTNEKLGEVSEPLESSGVTTIYASDLEIKGRSAMLWQEEGGDIYEEDNVNYSSLPLASQYFDDVEDVEVDITSLVEEWLQAEAASDHESATAEVTFSGTPADGSKIILTDTDGKVITYNFTNGLETGKYKGETTEIGVDTDASTSTVATNFATAIMAARAHQGTIGASTNGAIVQLTQSVPGWGGNRKMTTEGTTNATFSNSGYFGGGTALANNGVMLKLSGSYEDGSYEKSFYIKKFFARGTEYFFKKPVLEARWDASNLDDRGNFYVSSSLVSGDDNLHTLYLYNNFRGSLTNIPDVATGNIYLRLFNPSGVEVTTATPKYPITGGYHDTGIYTASFALETSETTIRDVWLTEDGAVQTQYYTGSFKPLQYSSSMIASDHDSEHVLKITNLRPEYTTAERPRFRLYTRKKNWQPNIYNVAKNSAPIDIVENSYFKIVREADSLEAIGYGTGSLNHTRLSHDMSGSYFDLDMSLLEPGYSYEVSFVFKLDGTFREQSEKFKFRVK
jgi:hypothetical protein